MQEEFRLPDVGEGITEGEIVNWMVSEGDRVEIDEAFVEVETDKAIIEIPSPVAGVVQELHAEEGDVVDVGEVLVTFDVEEGSVDDTVAESTGTSSSPEGDGEKPEERFDAEVIDGDRVFASPKTRRVARELGVDLASVEGSGEGGRVTEEDVREAADGQQPDASDAEEDEQDKSLAKPSTRRVAREEGVDVDEVPASGEREGEPYVSEEDVRSYASEGETVSYSGVRRSVGETMTESSRVPQVTHHDEADVTGLVESYPELKREAARLDVELTYTAFLVRACVAAIQRHPRINSMLDPDEEEIVVKDIVNVGVATATEDGLIVPVVKDADEMDLLETAGEINRLAERARNRELEPEELQNGTFTVTNIGAIGGTYATPLVNPPEAAILAVGSFVERPRVVDGDVVPRMVAGLSLSIDHRVLDGADAARFTNEVKRYLGTPELLLTERW